MKIGMNLPVMARGMDRDVTLQWCRDIDAGPWSSIATGERINFHNPEAMVMLAAAAAVTERVRIVSNVIVLPMHDPVMIAKQAATLDVLSGGRLTLGVGVGGRHEDYLAVGAEWGGSKLTRLHNGVDRMRAVWRGEKAHPDVLRPVEPFPVQDGGIEVLAGSLGPKSIERAAQWADGIIGFSFGLGGDELNTAFDLARAAWERAGRDTPPRLVTGTWFALGDDPDAQMDTYLREYLDFLGEEVVEVSAPFASVRGEAALRDAAQRCRDLGADELLLTPTSADPTELARAAEVLF